MTCNSSQIILVCLAMMIHFKVLEVVFCTYRAPVYDFYMDKQVKKIDVVGNMLSNYSAPELLRTVIDVFIFNEVFHDLGSFEQHVGVKCSGKYQQITNQLISYILMFTELERVTMLLIFRHIRYHLFNMFVSAITLKFIEPQFLDEKNFSSDVSRYNFSHSN